MGTTVPSIGAIHMDSTTAWNSVNDLIEAISDGSAPTGLGTAKPTPAAVHGAKLAMRVLRRKGTALDSPPAIIAMPWGSIVFWWRSFPQRRIEVLSRSEAYEFVETPEGTSVRQFMSGPPKPGESGKLV